MKQHEQEAFAAEIARVTVALAKSNAYFLTALISVLVRSRTLSEAQIKGDLLGDLREILAASRQPSDSSSEAMAKALTLATIDEIEKTLFQNPDEVPDR